jgi:hypothetical protein
MMRKQKSKAPGYPVSIHSERNRQKTPGLDGPEVAPSHLDDLERQVAGQVSKRMMRVVAFWVGCDLDCPLAAVRIKMSQREIE